MSLLPQTKELLSFLQTNPAVRAQIAAAPNTTLLYAGHFFRPVWQELEQLKRSNASMLAKQLLPEVLARIGTPGQAQPNLLAWAKALDTLAPWKENGFIVWRALSGIFAANAVGAVSFCIGSGIEKSDKVFAATELPVLARNPRVDAVTKDVIAYYQRCARAGQTAVNFGYVSG
ncbi:MAG: hypothetical protein ABI671_20170 [Burkholderiales bacterium]